MGNSLNDLGGLQEHVLGESEAERLGGLEIDDAVELARLLYWKVGGRVPRRMRST
jgi:hypothetical protein